MEKDRNEARPDQKGRAVRELTLLVLIIGKLALVGHLITNGVGYRQGRAALPHQVRLFN